MDWDSTPTPSIFPSFPFSLGLVSDNYLLRVARITIFSVPTCPISLVLLICSSYSSQSSGDSWWRDLSVQSASRLQSTSMYTFLIIIMYVILCSLLQDGRRWLVAFRRLSEELCLRWYHLADSVPPCRRLLVKVVLNLCMFFDLLKWSYDHHIVWYNQTRTHTRMFHPTWRAHNSSERGIASWQFLPILARVPFLSLS